MTNFSFSRSVSLFIPFKPRLVKVFFFYFFFTLCKSLLFLKVIENLSGRRQLINLLVCIIFPPFFKSHVLLYKNHREESGYDVHVFKYYRVNNTAATSFVAIFFVCKSLLFLKILKNLSGRRLLINLLVCIFPFFSNHMYYLYKFHREESGYDANVFKYYRVNNAATSFVAVGSPRTQCDGGAL